MDPENTVVCCFCKKWKRLVDIGKNLNDKTFCCVSCEKKRKGK